MLFWFSCYIPNLCTHRAAFWSQREASGPLQSRGMALPSLSFRSFPCRWLSQLCMGLVVPREMVSNSSDTFRCSRTDDLEIMSCRETGTVQILLSLVLFSSSGSKGTAWGGPQKCRLAETQRGGGTDMAACNGSLWIPPHPDVTVAV